MDIVAFLWSPHTIPKLLNKLGTYIHTKINDDQEGSFILCNRKCLKTLYILDSDRINVKCKRNNVDSINKLNYLINYINLNYEILEKKL